MYPCCCGDSSSSSSSGSSSSSASGSDLSSSSSGPILESCINCIDNEIPCRFGFVFPSITHNFNPALDDMYTGAWRVVLAVCSASPSRGVDYVVNSGGNIQPLQSCLDAGAVEEAPNPGFIYLRFDNFAGGRLRLIPGGGTFGDARYESTGIGFPYDCNTSYVLPKVYDNGSYSGWPSNITIFPD
uniref:Uncharacterized protein n=1 Tax=Rubinisphaera brasiliensis (strain ATCC 49424 / DSM 5305 / JCM 21570 / IAM 15109 / NBRC 103401 / IFAM 1448) TaxID=756272 RepID=F0SPG3_RUBBR|nr:hypothetical protein Plabr_0238 [Rubinisphaera brasiliensis DSM 5305]